MINQVDVPEAKDIWRRAFEKESHRVPFLSFEWYTNWLEIFGKEGTPHIFSINNELIGAFVQQGEELRFAGGEEFADYLDLVGPNGKKQDAWKEILETLPSLGVKKLTLRNIPQDSPTVSFFQSLQEAHVQVEDTTPILTLPESWDTYVESLPKKYRHELERKIRKFEREHTGFTLAESKNPERDIDTFLDLMERDEAKRKFLSANMWRFFELTAKTFTQQISLMITNIDNEPAAATLSFVDPHTVYLYNSGFNKQCCANAGFYTKAMTIKHAIETGRRTYNFLQGNERYKYELGGVDFHVYEISYALP